MSNVDSLNVGVADQDLTEMARVAVHESMLSAARAAFAEHRQEILSRVVQQNGVGEGEALALVEESLNADPWGFLFFVESRKFINKQVAG